MSITKTTLHSSTFLYLFFIYFMALSSLLCACGSNEENANSEPEMMQIMVHASSGESHINCSTPFQLNEEGPLLHLQDFKLFVHDVELKNKAGEWTSLQMMADGEWSNGIVTLLDYEDGSEHCSESGTLFMNHMIQGMIAPDQYNGIRFRIGVPFDLNHQDVTTAEAPLNLSSMFWVWQRGYKFARIELLQEQGDELKPWLFHLGSTGCSSEAATIAPESPCAKENSPFITIEKFDPSSQNLSLNLAGLLAGIDLEANTEETPQGCMSMPIESIECTPLFERLNLSFTQGDQECSNESCHSIFMVMDTEQTHEEHGLHEAAVD